MFRVLEKVLLWFGKNYYRVTGIGLWLTALLHFNNDTLFWICMVGAVNIWGIGFVAKMQEVDA